MKVTRRALARFAAAASAAGTAHSTLLPQALGQAPAAGRAETSDAELSPAARQLSQVKLPRATEPATRFEA